MNKQVQMNMHMNNWVDKSIDTDQHGQEYTEQPKEHAKNNNKKPTPMLNSTQDTAARAVGTREFLTNLCECVCHLGTKPTRVKVR